MGISIIDGEEIGCCFECVYFDDKEERCRWANRFKEHWDDCPPKWCPFKKVTEVE